MNRLPVLAVECPKRLNSRKKEINTTKQQAIDTITNQQNTSVNTVKTEGEKIITRVGNDAKTVADDRATVEEAAQTVLNNAQEVAQNTQTVASNTENAAASAESAKTSADNAAQSAKSVEDASKQIEQNKKDVASLKDGLSNKITKFYASNQGGTHITDSDNGKIQDMMIYGKLSQDGTPSPENPVEIKSVVNPTVKVINEDGLKVQSVTLNNITLNAIPVNSGGNVTIGEQQYVSDYVDIEKGKLYRKVKRLNLKDVDDVNASHGLHSNGNGYLAFSVNDASKEHRPISNRYKSSMWTDKSGYVYIPSNNSIIFVDDRFTDRQTAIKLVQDTYVIYALSLQTEEDLSSEQIKSLKSLSTYYPTTNISVNSEQLDGYTVFNYPISMTNGWNYVKQQLNDNRDYIYAYGLTISRSLCKQRIRSSTYRIGGMIMLYRTLLKLKERNGLTDDLKNKIDVFFAVGRITEEQYNELMDINKEEEPKAETN
ncbi:MAG: hypothetical protein ACLUKE_17255 [Blautia wexlerae]